MPEEKTNFDRYLERKLRDPDFRARFEAADQAWDIALPLAALRQARGLTQKQVAEMLGTKQQAIARSPRKQGRRRRLRCLRPTRTPRLVPGEQELRRIAIAADEGTRCICDASPGQQRPGDSHRATVRPGRGPRSALKPAAMPS
jgi:hypothetical protein